jgi:hypothetical protein
MRRLVPRAREIEEKDPVEIGVAVLAMRPGVTLKNYLAQGRSVSDIRH